MGLNIVQLGMQKTSANRPVGGSLKTRLTSKIVLQLRDLGDLAFSLNATRDVYFELLLSNLRLFLHSLLRVLSLTLKRRQSIISFKIRASRSGAVQRDLS